LVVTAQAFATTGTLVVSSDTTLTEDHHGAVWFAADSVTLDCAGHSVIGPAAAPSPNVGIGAFGRSGVGVRNCRVDGFGHGISLSGVTSFSLVGNTSANSEKVGIALYDASAGLVVRNAVTDSGWWGISAQNVHDVQFVGNRSASNGYDGFAVHTPWPQVRYTTGIRFVGNVSSGNGWDGFRLDELADGSTLFGNVADGNVHGFMIGSSNNTLATNVATGNAYTGFITAGWPSPFFLPPVRPAVGNTLRWNVARHNGVYDAADFNPAGTNTWQANWFGTSHGI
jgi:parallel beta-helix repeat protein